MKGYSVKGDSMKGYRVKGDSMKGDSMKTIHCLQNYKDTENRTDLKIFDFFTYNC